MATHHAAAGEVVDLQTWGFDVPEQHSKTIAKTDRMELARIALKAGEEWRSHQVDGPIVIHCLTGRMQCRALDQVMELGAGQLIHLPAEEPHGLVASEDTTLLLTIVFPR